MNMTDFANRILAGPPAPCAWCLKDMNLKPQPDETHGICAKHKAMEMAEFLRWKNIMAAEDAMAKERKP